MFVLRLDFRAVIFGIAMQFGNNTGTSVWVGAAFALSSTAIVMQLLSERHLLSRPVGGPA